MSSGSTIAIFGNVASQPKPIFSLPLVTTVHGSASVPVPAVVVTATIGSGGFGIGCALPVPPET